MSLRTLGIGSSLFVAGLALACGDSERRSGFTSDSDLNLPGTGGPTFGGNGPGKSGDCAINNVPNDSKRDFDGDGYALEDDCNECNKSINRGAHDIPGNGIDEDCSGAADDEEVLAAGCDADIDLATADPFDGAKAIGLCKKASGNGKDWGVVDAKWVKPDGKPLKNLLGIGVLSKFGVNGPQAGASMLALSSGFARAPGDPDFEPGQSQDKNYSSGTPAGYPKESPACPGVHTGGAEDGVALELTIRVPSNAHSLSYQQFFFTHEYPRFICTEFNDFFVAMLDPIPAGLPDGNIAFDQDTNPISVNNSLLQVCAPGTYKGKDFACPLGTGLLKATGFDEGGGTGWLTTAAPVKPGSEVTLRFSIWDSGDGQYDSTVLIDDFRFSVEGTEGARTKPSEPK